MTAGSLFSRVVRALGVLAARTLLAGGLLVTGGQAALAVPAFAVQTGQTCSGCHIGGFGPQLTPFGREFKMGGYTLRGNTFNAPVSVMAVASYLRTATDQAGPPATHFATNDNFAVDQVSLFLAGGAGSHFGGFVQGTYDGVAEAFHWDNLDLRAVTTATLFGKNTVLGLSVNNAPSVQDAFNTLPAWGFSYTSSALAPAPGAAPLMGQLAQNTIGVTGYAWFNSEIYLEAGGYWSPSQAFLGRAGVDPFSPGSIRDFAPYARIAYQRNFGDYNLEVGAFLLDADIYPGRDASAGMADGYRDLGLDGSLQYFLQNGSALTLNARYINERQRLNASAALGLSSNVRDGLQDLRFDASYYWKNIAGLTIGAFTTTGSSDALLYGSNAVAKPTSTGVNLQLDHTLFEGKGLAFAPRFNARIGLQGVLYGVFDGARHNYDGAGRNAGDNNTLRAFIWAAY